MSADGVSTDAGIDLTTLPRTVDVVDLERKVKEMYRLVAEAPRAEYHFELGRPLADRLGYDAGVLDRLPSGAVESFAGVGCVFGLAQMRPGDRVIDLGSGSGMDALYAAHLVGPTGNVLGIDFTPQQLARAQSMAEEAGLDNVEFREGRIEKLPADDESFDWVISNGVVNLSPEKEAVFAEVARVLRPGGQLAIADIVSERQLKEAIVCDADLWASCIGGAAQSDDYQKLIESAGLVVTAMARNPYEFLSKRAKSASVTYGVHSVGIQAVKPRV
jgi:ubiquinone/menaquinone biosynthesis C-methylase UbiE